MARYADCTEALRALAEGMDAFHCHDFSAVRQAVACHAWHEHQKGVTFGEALHNGWQAVRSACAPHGGVTPEEGFPTAWLSSGPPGVRLTYDIRNGYGATVGKIVTQDDGSITTCVMGDCRQLVASGAPSEDQAAVVEAMQHLFPVMGYTVVAEAPTVKHAVAAAVPVTAAPV